MSHDVNRPSMTPVIRPSLREDLPALGAVADATGLFSSEMLEGMTAGFFAGETPDEQWLTVDDGGPVAFAYCIPEAVTEGTWNVLAIAVHPRVQGRGHGTALMRHVEEALRARGERILLVETSGLPSFERARAFYRGLGFDEEARIRGFYAAGDDKVIFRKALQPGWDGHDTRQPGS
jgi:ribosomal protein S18 acetylase RimI-like enzyme